MFSAALFIEDQMNKHLIVLQIGKDGYLQKLKLYNAAI